MLMLQRTRFTKFHIGEMELWWPREFSLHQKPLLLVLKKRSFRPQYIKMAIRTFTSPLISLISSYQLSTYLRLHTFSHWFLIAHSSHFPSIFHRLCAWLCCCLFTLIAIILLVLVFSFTISIQTTFCFVSHSIVWDSIDGTHTTICRSSKAHWGIECIDRCK